MNIWVMSLAGGCISKYDSASLNVYWILNTSDPFRSSPRPRI